MTGTDVYVATTGTSIAGNLTRLAGGRDDRGQWLPADLVQSIDGLVSHPRDVADAPASLDSAVALMTTITEALRSSSAVLPDLADLGPLSAELQSLVAEGAPLPKDGDEIILVASDTDAGLQMAVTVAAFIGGPIFIHCADAERVSERSEIRGARDAGGLTAHVVWVENLATARPEKFMEGSRGLGRVLAWAFERVQDSGRLILHATGGYKVTIPVLMALAAHLPGRKPVEVWANHDATPAGIRLPILRLGPDDRLRDSLEIVASTGQPPNLYWEDYAYRRVPGSDDWTLTDLGAALYTMFEHLHRVPE